MVGSFSHISADSVKPEIAASISRSHSAAAAISSKWVAPGIAALSFYGSNDKCFRKPYVAKFTLKGKSNPFYIVNYHSRKNNDKLDEEIIRFIDYPQRPGAERTYSQELSELDDRQTALRRIAEVVSSRMKQGKHRGKTITVKLHYSAFTTQTRSRSINHFTEAEAEIYTIAAELLNGHPRQQALRLIGIAINNLDTKIRSEGGQLTLDFSIGCVSHKRLFTPWISIQIHV